MTMKYYRLTTKDNPHDVFEDYVNWANYDHQMGYNTAELLARIARTSDELSEEENQKEIERAIDIIIAMHPQVDEENKEEKGVNFVKVSKDL